MTARKWVSLALWANDFIRASLRLLGRGMDIGGRVLPRFCTNFADISEKAQRALRSVLNQMAFDKEPVVITRRGAHRGVVMPLSEFNALKETAHLLESPANAVALYRSIGPLPKQVVTRHGIDPIGFNLSQPSFRVAFFLQNHGHPAAAVYFGGVIQVG